MDLLIKVLIKIQFQKFSKNLKFNGGEGGIRTHERVAPLLVFKTSAFNRSATSPKLILTILLVQKYVFDQSKIVDTY